MDDITNVRILFGEIVDLLRAESPLPPAFTDGASYFLAVNAPLVELSTREIIQFKHGLEYFTPD